MARFALYSFCVAVLALICNVLAGPVLEDADPCSPDKCKLPDCLCSSTTPPNGGDGRQNPQIVLVTFDDAITSDNYKLYNDLLTDRVNPNGCNIGATFFVAHPYNQYDLTHKLWSLGHEIALNSVTHHVDPTYWKNLPFDEYIAEIGDGRSMLEIYGMIPKEDINGFRVPSLQTAGNTYFEALQNVSVGYDSTMPTFVDPPLFPYTLDYKTTQDCQIPPCPTESFPKEWEVPIVHYIDDFDQPCSTIDACHLKSNDSDAVYGLIMRNFNRHYNSNRAPFGLFLNSKWLQSAENLNGCTRFLDILAVPYDVFIVSVSDAIAWMKQPTAMDQIYDFKPWACKNRPFKCDSPHTCKYTFPQGDVFFHSCVPCPKNYPWLHNPLGN